MNPVRFIRSKFGMSQEAFAELLGISQAQVSRLENDNNALMPGHQKTIREAARERGIEWQDAWFWEPPQEAA